MVRGSRAVAGVFAAAAVLVGAAPSFAADRDAQSRVMAVDGVAKHRSDMRVEILVEVPAGASAREAGERALEAQGAKPEPAPPQSAAFTFTGLFWNTLPVVQNYNPAGQPTTAAAAVLGNTYNDLELGAGLDVPDRLGRHDLALPVAGPGLPRDASKTTASTTSAGCGSPAGRSA